MELRRPSGHWPGRLRWGLSLATKTGAEGCFHGKVVSFGDGTLIKQELGIPMRYKFKYIDGLRKTGDAPGHKPKINLFCFWSLPKQRKKGTPPPPFHILNFKIFIKSKTKQFLELETHPGAIFWRYLRCFLHLPKSLHEKLQLQKLSKNH